MPSTPSTAAQVLLLAPTDAALLASPEADVADECILVPTVAAPRRPAFFALLVSLLLHALVGAALWQWTQQWQPAPESPVLQVRLRAGGGKPATPVMADQPPAPAAPVAATPAPPRPPAPKPAPLPPEPAKTATLPAPAPVVASHEPEPILPTPTSPADTEQAGTSVLTPPVDPLVNTATVRVLEWLSQHRRYPGPARRAKLQGTVEIIVVLMPDGRLVDQRIAQSSGHAILDKAALDLLRRASPVPASAFFTGEARQLELRLPIIYRLSI
jgi:protein TonB